MEEGGFILINDYGQTKMTGEEEFEHQRFSLATFVGVNFAELKEYFEGQLSAVSDQLSAAGGQQSSGGSASDDASACSGRGTGISDQLSAISDQP